MKRIKLLAWLLILTMLTAAVAACEDQGNGGVSTTDATTQATVGTTVPETTAPEATTEATQSTTAGTTAGTTVGGTTTGGNEPPVPPELHIITIAEALELCGEEGNITTERYYICGVIESITNAAYGAMVIRDETGSIPVYGTYSEDGSINYSQMTEKPYKGDEVLLYCILQNYNGTKEVQNARLISFTRNEVEIDLTKYTDMSIADARKAATGTLIKADGVVARITYANGMKPSGFYLVDDTNSIYVYDADLAQRVKLGTKLTVAGSKTYWILDTEQSNAQKFGYKGCSQLEDVTLVEIDEKNTYEFDTSWIPQSTVKAILETPVTEDITTTIFKVNALVQKKIEPGYVNYYFYDIDGKTGTYTYTQCNGSDFEWLDAFDGKICTVYLSAINAKSTATACYFRLLPIAVKYENFAFDLKDAPKFAVEYYGLDQFRSNYEGDPATELVTSVSSALLGFENVLLNYTSSNNDVVSFENKDGKVILHCAGNGKATVTVTATHNGNTYHDTIEISVVAPVDYECVDVKTAIETNVDEIVTVKGIVGPSVVNKSGFYLIDESGAIAVLVKNASVFEDIEIGNEIILRGRRETYRKDNGSTAYFGQTCIVDAEILTNYYGENDYSTASFNNALTFAEFASLKITEDQTTQVYMLEAKIEFVGSTYSSNAYLKDAQGHSVLLYCSKATDQYAFLKQFDGQTVTVEVVACNWNDKTQMRACVLSVITDDGKILNTLNFGA